MRLRSLFWVAAGALILPALGCGKGRSTDEVLIGEYGSLTGGIATFGISTKNGSTMAFDEINGAGGVLGKKFKLLVEDDQKFELLAEDAAGAVDLVEGHRRTVLRRDSEGRDAARQRPVFPDEDLVRRSALAATQSRQNQGRCRDPEE